MDYLLTDEQKMLKEMVENFGREKIAPVAAKHDEEASFPKEIVEEAAALGLFGVAIPPEYGGAGMDYVSYMLAVEGVSRYCASTGVIISAHSSLAADPILKYGTEEQKQKFLVPLASGEHLGSYCLTEPHSGSDAAGLKTIATKDGDNWIINGTKQFITNAAEAHTLVVFVATDPEAGYKGVTAFIIPTDTPGVSIGKHENKLGIRASSTAQVIFEDVVVPKEYMLGEEGQGFKIALATLDGGRIGIASQALGIARASIEESIAYSKEREQFGQPISKFQGIQWYLAEMGTDYEAAWLLTWRAATMKDQGLRFTKEASMAKWKASLVAETCSNRAIQIHGGYGYIKEYNPERYYRDAKITQIYEGTSEIQKEVIAHWMLNK